jgi:hypothetical protein
MNKSGAWRAIEKMAELNELVYALNRFGEKTGLNRGGYRLATGIGAARGLGNKFVLAKGLTRGDYKGTRRT